MVKIIQKISIAFLAFFSTTAFALCSQTNNTISLLGVKGLEGVHTELAFHDDQCSCNYANLNQEKIDTARALSLLMSAKFSGKKVRIDFEDIRSCDAVVNIFLQ